MPGSKEPVDLEESREDASSRVLCLNCSKMGLIAAHAHASTEATQELGRLLVKARRLEAWCANVFLKSEPAIKKLGYYEALLQCNGSLR